MGPSLSALSVYTLFGSSLSSPHDVDFYFFLWCSFIFMSALFLSESPSRLEAVPEEGEPAGAAACLPPGPSGLLRSCGWEDPFLQLLAHFLNLHLCPLCCSLFLNFKKSLVIIFLIFKDCVFFITAHLCFSMN